MRSILPALLVSFPSIAGALEPSVELKDVPLGGQRFAVVATVTGPALPITVTLEPGSEYLNCAPSAPLPLSRVLSKPGETVLVEVGPSDAKVTWRCHYQFKTALGATTRGPPDDCAFALPFTPRGTSRVLQGFDGALTHRDRVRHAIDFAMPEGTPVRAAREGLVTWIQDDEKDGARPGGNTVSLLHVDGTLSQYAHLKRGSVVVREGQTISRGTILALSGSTNDTPIAPHLHFEVFVSPGSERRTLPFTFSLGGGVCRTPKEGEQF